MLSISQNDVFLRQGDIQKYFKEILFLSSLPIGTFQWPITSRIMLTNMT
jgi:hypothetical protein